MATPAQVNYTPLTNTRVWFASVQAFNDWAGALTVTITAANLPEPTTTTLGGVKKLELAAYNSPAVAGDTYSLNIDGVASLVPSQALVDSLQAKVNYMDAQLQALFAQLIAKGYV